MGANSQSFSSLKESGNQLFVKTTRDDTQSPALYQQQMCQALQYYNLASNLVKSALEKSFIRKNIAVTQLRVGQRLKQILETESEKVNKKEFDAMLHHYRSWRSPTSMLNSAFRSVSILSGLVSYWFVPRVQGSPSDQSSSNEPILPLIKEDLQYFLEESLKNFGEAIEIGQEVQSSDWTLQVRKGQQECRKLYWNFFSDSNSTGDEFSVLCGRLHQFCWEMTGSARAQYFLKLGHLTFHKAIQYQEKNLIIQSIQLLHNNYLNIEEAKKLDSQLEEAVELEESNFTH